MNIIHSANISVKKEYDNEIHEYYVVIEDVKIFDSSNKEIKEKDITNNFIGVKTNEIDHVLIQYVAEKLDIKESDVNIEYLED